nr:uncharacterized protein LOC109159944 [Ipomoea batatas]
MPTLEVLRTTIGYTIGVSPLQSQRAGYGDGEMIRFLISACWLWRWRNDKIFNQKISTPSFKSYRIQIEVAEINSSFSRLISPRSTPANRSWKLYRWNKPPPGWVKINVDGSHNPQAKKVACGGLARDEFGNLIKGFTHSIGEFPIEVAEAWALLKGI